MKHPAKNRPCGGMGPTKTPKGSAGKMLGAGKPINGGTGYRPKGGGKTAMGYGPMSGGGGSMGESGSGGSAYPDGRRMPKNGDHKGYM